MNTATDNLDAALFYASLGWHVFPVFQVSGGACACGEADCDNPGKHPRIKGGLNSASIDPELIRRWWRQWPLANVAIRCGKVSGITVIDKDTKDDKGGEETWQSIVQQHGHPPETLMARTGSGGFHYVHAYRPDLITGINRLGKGIDVRNDGAYIVAPPSNHLSGGVYEWLGDPASTPRSEIPDWLAGLAMSGGNLDGLVRRVNSTPDDNRVHRCREYLKRCGDAISGSGGHNATFRAACECFRFGLSDAEARQMMEWFNATKCQPPWKPRELEHKLKQARDKVMQSGDTGKHLRSGLDPEPFGASPRVIVGDVIDEVPHAPEANEPNRKPVFPARLLEPSGLIGVLCRWINETAIKPQPILALGNSLAFFGAVVGQKVRTPSNLRSNLYCLGVGPSGCGKDHSRKCIISLLTAADMTEYLGGRPKSASALVSAVRTRPSILFQWDEVGHFFRNAINAYASPHQKEIPPTLTMLFSEAGSIHLGDDYADRRNNPREPIHQPNACVYGTTVPNVLYDGLTPSELQDGFLARNLVFETYEDPEEQAMSEAPVPPPELVTAIRAWHDRRDLPTEHEGNLARPAPFPVPFNEEAHAKLQQFKSRVRQHLAKARPGSGIDTLWTRAAEHAQKVALTVAAGCSFTGITVTGDIMGYAIELVEHLVGRLAETVDENVSGSEFGRDTLRVLRAIKSMGKMTLTVLGRRTQGMHPKQRKQCLEELIMTGRIFETREKQANGKEAWVYSITPPVSAVSAA